MPRSRQMPALRGLRNEAVKFLESPLAQQNPTVRTTAAEALARIGHEDSAIPVSTSIFPNSRIPGVSMTRAPSGKRINCR